MPSDGSAAPAHAIANMLLCLAARIAPELCFNFSPLESRGRGECRVPNAPAAWCALGVVSMHTSIHSGGTGNIRHSPRNGFTAYNALSSVTGLFCHRRFVDDRTSLPGWARATPYET